MRFFLLQGKFLLLHNKHFIHGENIASNMLYLSVFSFHAEGIMKKKKEYFHWLLKPIIFFLPFTNIEPVSLLNCISSPNLGGWGGAGGGGGGGRCVCDVHNHSAEFSVN